MTIKQDSLVKLQQDLEEDAITLGINKFNEQEERMGGMSQAGIGFLKGLVIALEQSFTAWITQTSSTGKAGSLKAYFRGREKYFTHFCVVAVKEAWKQAASNNRWSRACGAVGSVVLDEAIFCELKAEIKGLDMVIERKGREAAWLKRRTIMDLAKLRDIVRPSEETKVGIVFCRLLLDTGFFRLENWSKDKNDTDLRFNFTEEAEAKLSDEQTRLKAFATRWPICVIKPLPWEDVYGGGYHYALKDRLRFIKRTSFEHLQLLHESRDKLKPVYEAINSMQNTGWRVNKRVLDVINTLEAEGCPDIAGIPVGVPVEYPERPPEGSPRPLFRRWLLERMYIREANFAKESKRRAYLLQLSAARQWSAYPAFYFPHTVDWRWRVYPVGLPLSPQSDSTGKAMLEFAEGKPLGAEGIRWLAIHGANVWGNDKLPLADRLAWVEEYTEEILRVAADPLSCLFWTEADKPLMFLAFCFEWAGRMEQGEAWVSHLPCAVDGSQNGLQHYALLIRCEKTARAVNVIPLEKPNDLYSAVMEDTRAILEDRVKEVKLSEKDLEEGWRGLRDVRSGLLAQDRPVPEDIQVRFGLTSDQISVVKALREVDRGLCKRPVMTYSYSVTEYGITEQCVSELTQRELNLDLSFDHQWIKPVSLYLTPILVSSIEGRVIAAAKAMRWLRKVLSFTESTPDGVVWWTPMGVPINQRYRKSNSKRVVTSVGSIRFYGSAREETRSPDTRKSSSAIAPNFIHSLDAAHLQRSVLKAKELGVGSFAMVHDSYGSHAADMGKVLKALKEAAVEQYSQDLLVRFAEDILGKDWDTLVEPMEMGDLDVKQVLDSDYFFA